jgi:hypothetical protein
MVKLRTVMFVEQVTHYGRTGICLKFSERELQGSNLLGENIQNYIKMNSRV